MSDPNVSFFIMMALIFAIFYFLLIRPQQKRLKAHREMIEALKIGDQVVTAGGILGKVKKVDDAEAVVDVADGVQVKVIKHTITEVRGKTEPAKA